MSAPEELLATVAEAGGVSVGLIEATANLLRNFPDSGRLIGWEGDAITAAQAFGYIELNEARKRCQHCGAEIHDFTYFKITPAGRLFLAMTEALRAHAGGAQ